MGREDWYRNNDWSSTIEAAFFAKLGRARTKHQYLRIQARTLARCQPEVALRLLDEYFKLGDSFDHALAHVDRASAYLALGDTEAAIAAYEAALNYEEHRPNVKTQAYLDLPFMIASLGITSRYEQALLLLEHHQARLVFPLEHFRWHAAQTLILSARCQNLFAREHAQLALKAAALDHSGFRFHSSVGLVGARYKDIRERLEALAA
jgi:hypothetical protein